MPQKPPDRADRFEDLLEIVRVLRDPDGCPWDRAQTHASLRQYLLEECYEAIDSIDHRDAAGLSEELGDLLVHIAFHADMAARQGEWTAAELVRRTARKLVRRHPHVFSDAPAMDDADAVVEQWEALKRAERGNRRIADGVPQSLPALSLVSSLQRRAESAKLPPPEGGPALSQSALEQLDAAPEGAEREKIAGRLLAHAVSELRKRGVDAETALRAEALRYRSRLRAAEDAAGKPLADLEADERERVWAEAGG